MMELGEFLDLHLTFAQLLLQPTDVVLGVGQGGVEDADVVALLLQGGPLGDQLDFLAFFGGAQVFVFTKKRTKKIENIRICFK